MANEVVQSVQTGHGFLQKKTPFDAMLRRVQKVTPAAIDFLEATMKNKESKDEKLKVEAAKKLIDVHMSLMKEKNNDKISRLEKQIRLMGKSDNDGEFSTAGDDYDDTPLVNFDEVIDVS